VTPAAYTIDSGFEHGHIRIAKADSLVGGAVAAGETGATNDTFPNQDCGEKECTPAAVSNSLMFLNDKFSLGIDAAELTIAKMKAATGWQPGGTNQDTWFKTKKAYVASKKWRITTSVINPTSLADVVTAVKNRCDVELVTSGHTAAVVGIVQQANGNYPIEGAHDPDQGH